MEWSRELVAAAVVVHAGGRRFIDATWLQVVPLAGALLGYGLAEAIGGSGFIAAFVGGMVFGGLRRRRGGDVSYLMEQTGALLAAVTFVVFGAILLGPALGDLTWQIALYAVLSLTLVRMVPVAIAMLGTSARRPTVAFLGWFGPRGAASIVFALLLLEEESALPNQEYDPDDGVRHRRALGARARRDRRAPRDALRGLARRAVGPERRRRPSRTSRPTFAGASSTSRRRREDRRPQDEARRIAVRAQLLDGSATTVLDTVQRLGFLQIDPISTVAPPQQLVLWSRLGPYDVAELDRLLWVERKLFEWNAYIWPIESLPLVKARMRAPQRSSSTRTSAGARSSSSGTRASSATCCASSSARGRCSRASSSTSPPRPEEPHGWYGNRRSTLMLEILHAAASSRSSVAAERPAALGSRRALVSRGRDDLRA